MIITTTTLPLVISLLVLRRKRNILMAGHEIITFKRYILLNYRIRLKKIANLKAIDTKIQP